MIKTKLLLLLVLLLNVLILPQRALPVIENIDYPVGAITIVGGPDWIGFGNTPNANDYMVVTGNLSYAGYPMPETGNRIGVTSANQQDVYLSIVPQNGDGKKVYASFLLNVTGSSGTFLMQYVFGDLGYPPVGFPSQGVRLYYRLNANGTKFNLGTGRSGLPDSPTGGGYSGDLDFNTTYLIVVSYEFVAGSDNDLVKLWINPDLSGAEPLPTLSGGVGVSLEGFDDNPAIGGLLLRQASGTPTAFIDAIRISNSWSDSPLPVELSSFSAATIGSTVKLNWRTDTEVNNFGFEVERTSPIPSPYQGEGGEAGRGWEKIGFVNGNGNSNSPKDYSFEDNTINSGRYSYRLKQIDNDGQIEYSKTIEVDLGAPKKFELSQNYPNPFNPVTTIRFNLPETGIVKLTLYNVLGQEVKTLLNENKEAGVYTVNFDASELNSGVYIYKLESGSFVQTRKMMLLK